MTRKKGQEYSFTEPVKNRPARLAIYFIGEFDSTLCVVNRNSGKPFDNGVTEISISRGYLSFSGQGSKMETDLIKKLLWNNLNSRRMCDKVYC